jgi:TRAP-type transport system periplasmic protein
MPNMLDVKWSPMYGVVVVSRGAWEKIPADLRPRLLAAARSIGREMNSANVAAEKQAVDVMLARGLRITQPQAADLDLWRDVARDAAARLVGKIVDRESYQQATTDLESIRR